MKAPLISVIIPAYNIAQYVEKTIASVLAQTYGRLEVIAVDDGSCDETGEILDRLSASVHRLRVIHKENGGVTSARLRGLKEAAGEWIAFADGDDYLEPQMYERLLGNALQYGADISHCGYQMVFPHGHVDYYCNTGRLEQKDRQAGLMALLEGAYIEPSLCSKLFHKNVFVNLPYMEKKLHGICNMEDLLMNYYLFREAEKSVYEDFCPYHYQLRDSSAATSDVSAHKLMDPVSVFRILLKETEGESAVYALVRRRYIRCLIGNATLDCRKKSEMVAQCCAESRKTLRGELKRIMTEHGVPAKLKAMALWAGLMPETYGFVHQLYAKLKGIDRIYSLDK